MYNSQLVITYTVDKAKEQGRLQWKCLLGWR